MSCYRTTNLSAREMRLARTLMPLAVWAFQVGILTAAELEGLFRQLVTPRFD